jgi:cell division protein FtsW
MRCELSRSRRVRSSSALRADRTHALPLRHSRPEQAPPDTLLFAAVAALVGIGLVMIYSASSVTAYAEHLGTAYYLKRQFLWLAVGSVLAYGAYRIDYLLLRRYTPYLLLGCIAGLMLAFVPHVGVLVNGAHRWIGYRSMTLQPSEFAKLGLVIFLAAWLSGRAPHIDIAKLTSLIAAFAPIVVIAGLILKEPDFGTASLIVMVGLVMLFAAGARIAHLMAVLAAMVPAGALMLIHNVTWRTRIFAFVNPWRDPENTGFHIIQSLYALGSGGLFGVGLGASREKFFYLPEQYTDFIFSVLGEEWGLVGALIVVALFVVIAFKSVRIALSAREPFGFLLAIGCGAMIVVQAFVNIGVVTSSWPVTGVPLPFVSFGGSALVVDLIAIALILNVGRQRRST